MKRGKWSLSNHPGDNSAQNERDVRDKNLPSALPRIYSVIKCRRYPLTYVIQWSRSQRKYMAAEQEMNQGSIRPPDWPNADESFEKKTYCSKRLEHSD